MLKKLEIAHMMDAYEEEEFVPEEEALVDPQRVRTAVMGRVRRGRTRRILLTAAVLAACLGLVGWTYGERVYQFMCGGRLVSGEHQTSLEWDKEARAQVLSVEEGRVWFVADGQRLDITDRIDEETPYLYAWQDGQGNRSGLIVGGTPEHCGWAEIWERADGMESAEFYDGTVVEGGPEEDPDWLVQGRQQLQALWAEQGAQRG